MIGITNGNEDDLSDDGERGDDEKKTKLRVDTLHCYLIRSFGFGLLFECFILFLFYSGFSFKLKSILHTWKISIFSSIGLFYFSFSFFLVTSAFLYFASISIKWCNNLFKFMSEMELAASMQTRLVGRAEFHIFQLGRVD